MGISAIGVPTGAVPGSFSFMCVSPLPMPASEGQMAAQGVPRVVGSRRRRACVRPRMHAAEQGSRGNASGDWPHEEGSLARPGSRAAERARPCLPGTGKGWHTRAPG